MEHENLFIKIQTLTNSIKVGINGFLKLKDLFLDRLASVSYSMKQLMILM